MKIESIEITNFRAFHGEHTIDIASDEKKSVTVIVAENGIGKSAILEAIHWCLYGEMPEGADIHDNVINDFSEELDSTAQANVKIKVTDDNKSYILSRNLPKEGAQSIAKISELNENVKGFVPDKTNREEFVQSFIPQDLKEFFLFNGERVRDLFEQNEEKLKESIEHIQGLTFLNRGLEDIDRFYSSLLDLKDKEQRQKSAEEGEDTKIENLNAKAEAAKSDLEDQDKVLTSIEGSIEKLTGLIKNSGHEELKKAIKANEVLEKELPALHNTIRELYENRKKLISEHGFMVMGFGYKQSVDTFIDNKYKKDKAFPAAYTEAFLESLLENELCICGEKIDTPKKVAALKEALSKGVSNNVSIIIKDIQAALGAYEQANRNYQRETLQFSYQIQTEEGRVKAIKKQIEENMRVIEEIPDKSKDVEKWLEQRESLYAKKDEEYEKRGRLKLQYDIAKDSWDQAVQNSARGSSRANDSQLNDKILFIEESRDYLIRYIEKYARTGRAGLLAALNHLAEKFSTGGMHFEYANENSLNPMFLKQGETFQGPLNTGEKVMKSIYFACAAIKHNKDRVNKEDDWLSEGVNAPLIADAPFSALGVINLPSAAEMIINGPQQSVVLINAKDFNAGFEQALNKSNKLGRLYYMQGKRRGEGGTEVKDKTISIGSMSVPAFLHNQEEDTAVIYEVDI